MKTTGPPAVRSASEVGSLRITSPSSRCSPRTSRNVEPAGTLRVGQTTMVEITGLTEQLTGSAPGPEPHPVVLQALHEVGIDAADHVPHRLDDEDVQWADVVVATCDDACPVIPGKRYVSWHLPDPKGRPLDEVRGVRDEIESRVEELVAELDHDAQPKRPVT